jgi:L-seryl-tRNA(Ser) seleniumtransferase
VLLKVHQSNFVQRGFVESVDVRDLAALAKKNRVPLVYDNGSGLLAESELPFLESEPSVEQGLKDGASIVILSGDKLLGSVQAGIIVGKAAFVKAMRKHPLYRALRLDKIRLALLHQTLGVYLAGDQTSIPLWHMASANCDELEARGKKRLRLPKASTRWKRSGWVRVPGYMGGGSNPETSFESVALELVHKDYSAEQLKSRFATRTVPVVGYIRKGTLLLDIRTVLDDDLPELQHAMDELS